MKMKYLELTENYIENETSPVLIRMDQINYITPHGDECRIVTSNGTIIVMESYDIVMAFLTKEN
jgi:hypothetical protein